MIIAVIFRCKKIISPNPRHPKPHPTIYASKPAPHKEFQPVIVQTRNTALNALPKVFSAYDDACPDGRIATNVDGNGNVLSGIYGSAADGLNGLRRQVIRLAMKKVGKDTNCV